MDVTIVFFFFNDTATTEIYTLSLHDALPISSDDRRLPLQFCFHPDSDRGSDVQNAEPSRTGGDRKSTRLNSSHTVISYAVFCLKKKSNTSENLSPFSQVK